MTTDPLIDTVRRFITIHKPTICECGHGRGEHKFRYSTPSGTGWCAHDRCHCESFVLDPKPFPPEQALNALARRLEAAEDALREIAKHDDLVEANAQAFAVYAFRRQQGVARAYFDRHLGAQPASEEPA